MIEVAPAQPGTHKLEKAELNSTMAQSTEFRGAPINLNDWMKEQPVSCCQTFAACCRPNKVRRRYARMVLFKRLTVEELERRYRKQQARTRPEEDQAIRQAIENFRNGWYIGVGLRHTIGTFYSPLSPLFTWLVALPIQLYAQLHYLLPSTSHIVRSFLRKDNHSLCCAYVFAALFPLFFPIDILWLLVMMLGILLALLLVLLVEIPIFIVGICWYRCRRLQKLGVFVYHCNLYLITAHGSATRSYGTTTRRVTVIQSDMGAEVTLPHASLCRTSFRNPVVNIFGNLHWQEYSYGDIEDHVVLSTDDVQMYKLRQEQSAALSARAQRLA